MVREDAQSGCRRGRTRLRLRGEAGLYRSSPGGLPPLPNGHGLQQGQSARIAQPSLQLLRQVGRSRKRPLRRASHGGLTHRGGSLQETGRGGHGRTHWVLAGLAGFTSAFACASD